MGVEEYQKEVPAQEEKGRAKPESGQRVIGARQHRSKAPPGLRVTGLPTTAAPEMALRDLGV